MRPRLVQGGRAGRRGRVRAPVAHRVQAPPPRLAHPPRRVIRQHVQESEIIVDVDIAVAVDVPRRPLIAFIVVGIEDIVIRRVHTPIQVEVAVVRRKRLARRPRPQERPPRRRRETAEGVVDVPLVARAILPLGKLLSQPLITPHPVRTPVVAVEVPVHGGVRAAGPRPRLPHHTPEPVEAGVLAGGAPLVRQRQAPGDRRVRHLDDRPRPDVRVLGELAVAGTVGGDVVELPDRRPDAGRRDVVRDRAAGGRAGVLRKSSMIL